MENTASFYLANVGSIPAGRAINTGMNILIIGDSWGVPNYPSPDPAVRHYGSLPEHHTEFLLKNLGHNIYNFAKNSGSNLQSIYAARKFLDSTDVKVDWIIWFHTEALRDRSKIHLDDFYIPVILEQLYTIIYIEFEKFRINAAADTIVIGGQAPVADCFYKIVNATHVIKDWRSEILEQPLEPIHTLCHLDIIEKSSDSIEYKNRLMQNHDLILDLKKSSDDFPDNCHPGQQAHENLVYRLQALIV